MKNKIQVSRICSTYKDGGTSEIRLTDGRIFYIDKRRNSKTQGEAYDAYPSEGNIVKEPLNFEIKKAFKKYQQSRCSCRRFYNL